jgi:hypothetical protein
MPTKLTEKQVVEIRERYADGSTTPELARDFGVSFRHVSGIASAGATGGRRADHGQPAGSRWTGLPASRSR